MGGAFKIRSYCQPWGRGVLAGSQGCGFGLRACDSGPGVQKLIPGVQKLKKPWVLSFWTPASRIVVGEKKEKARGTAMRAASGQGVPMPGGTAVTRI